jgi:hypothetical protein
VKIPSRNKSKIIINSNHDQSEECSQNIAGEEIFWVFSAGIVGPTTRLASVIVRHDPGTRNQEPGLRDEESLISPRFSCSIRTIFSYWITFLPHRPRQSQKRASMLSVKR